MKTLGAYRAGWLCFTLAASMASNPMRPALADELDVLIDDPSAYCQDVWVQIADGLKDDANALAEARNQYPKLYAACMQGVKAEIAKRQRETAVERQARQDVDRWSAECLQDTKNYVSRQISQLPTSYSELDRRNAVIRYFKFYQSQCMDTKLKASGGAP